MLSVIKAVLSNPKDKTEISLIFANTDIDNVLLMDELDKLAANHPQFKVFYVLGKVPLDCSY
jgi:cytochrome-b5 reductase